ncbi:hypothetical protein [Pseudophaeobacter sp.]|jgi:hypothetical protein|uniref:hypothetical protein n=1 Tax=Pseudophaeobacter sp. TaxID=1971739 RepID=UPI0032D92AA3
MAGYLNSLLFATVTLFSGAGLAADTFTCTLTPVTTSGWIPSKVSMQFLESDETARIRASEEGGSMHAVLRRRSDDSYLLDWTPSRALAAKAAELSNDRYRAILNLGNLKVSLQVLSHALPGTLSPRGAGTCIRLD